MDTARGNDGHIPLDAGTLRDINVQNGDLPRVTSHPAILLAVVLVSYAMLVLDVSIVITALPQLEEEFGFTPAELSWVQSAYTLTFGGLLLLGARAGDVLGRRRMFTVGLGVFAVASLGVAVAHSVTMLLAARALQGVGAAVLAPSTLALLTTNFAEGRARTRALAYYSAVAGVGAAFGLVLGGLLAGWHAWRWGFFINVPVGVITLVLGHAYLVESNRTPGRFDVSGALASTLGMTSLVFGLVHSATSGWADPVTAGALVAGVALLCLLVVREHFASQPIMPLRLFRSRVRSTANLSRMLFLGAMVGFWFFTSQYMQLVLGFTPLQTGLAFLPMTIVNGIVAFAVPRLTQRWGNGPLLATGLVVTAMGMAWLSRVSPTTPYLLDIAGPMMLIGGGQGATLAPLTSAGMTGIDDDDAGAASGLVNAAHQLGAAIGLAALVAISATAVPAGATEVEAAAARVTTAFTAGAVMLAIACALVLGFVVRASAKR